MTEYAREIHARLMGGEPLDKLDHADHTVRRPKYDGVGPKEYVRKSPYSGGFRSLGEVTRHIMVDVEKAYNARSGKCSR